jgi:hypothetical protein
MSKHELHKLVDSPTLRTIRNKWVQAGIAGIPYIGGPIQVYLSNVVADLDRKAWQAYWSSVEERLSLLHESKVSADYFTSEDFVRRLRRIHSQVVSGCDETKLHYLRDYLISCMSEVDIDVTWKDLFLKHLSEMTGVHILVLRIFFERQKHLSYKDRFELPQRIGDSPLCICDVASSMGTEDVPLIELVVADLSASGLLGAWLGEPREPKAWAVTETGLKLMEFLSNAGELPTEM